MPEGQNGQSDGAETSHNEEHVVDAVKRSSHIRFISVRQKTASVEHGLGKVLEDQQAEGDTSVGKGVGSGDKCQVEDGVLDAGWHVLSLDLLEIELGENVEPVGDLHDVKELEHKGHLVVRIAFPQLADAEQVLAHDDVAGPQQTDDVKAQQLATLVELGVLDLGQVKLAIDSIQKVFLNDLVHDDGNQQIEENGWQIFNAGGIMDDVLHLTGGCLHRNSDIMVECYEERGKRR